MSGRRLLAAAVLAAAGLSACGERSSSTAPDPVLDSRGAGVLAVRLDAPDDSTGSVLLTVAGGPVDSVSVACGCEMDADLGSDTRIFIAGALPRSGIVARLYVPAGAAASGYTVAVEQAAVRGTWGRTNPAAFQAVIVAAAP